ncbi:MAG: hypothetical protein KC547_08595 [Anaerolineae bacterium]|nr:hypothetical protein [Anaerolineae bacterium]
MTSAETILQRRDAKVKSHLTQYAPVWIVNETIIAEDEAVQFEAVFQHNLYGWVSRRYRYDSFNDVLYFKGQGVLSEEAALNIQEQEPYIAAQVADIPNAYGG